jgi:hypothetical protein
VAGVVVLVGLNPSDAGADKDDMTIRKGVGFASRWGYDKLVMVNVNPIISTDPYGLPPWNGLDQENIRTLRHWVTVGDLVVAAWGSVPNSIARTIALPELIYAFKGISSRTLYCIGRTKNGSPCHPSRVAYTAAPLIYAEGDEV